MNKERYIIPILFLLSSSWVLGQEEQGRERGEVTDAEFIIRKDRVLSMPEKPRNFEKVPTLPQPEGMSTFNYNVRDFFLQLEPVKGDIQAYQRKFDATTGDLYHGLVRLGYGNYQSPLAELHLNNLESDVLNYGVYLKHQGFYEGPVDQENSAEDHTQIRLEANYFAEYFELFGKIGYNRDKYHFYGYTPGLEVNADDIGQMFHTLYGDAGIRNIDRMDPFNYELSIGARLFNDDYLAREHQVHLNAKAYYNINEAFRAGIETQAFATSPSDQTYSDLNRNYFKATPYLSYKSEGFQVFAGANLIVENDDYAGKSSDFHVFPTLDASYHLQEEFALYAKFEGDVIRNTYYGFAMENPFLGPSETLRNTVQNYKAEAGIKGSVNDSFTYKLGASYGQFDQMHFYGNHPEDSTRFQIVYDTDTRVLNYTAALEYDYDKTYGLSAEANYYHYTLEDIGGAWHRPQWELKVNNTFTPDHKWLIVANANLMGGIHAVNFESGATSTLNPIIDLNVKADYKITDRFSVFAQGNNLLSQKNQRYWNYQARGIQGIGGLTFKF